MSHHSTVLMFHVSPPSLLDRLDSTLVPTRSRMGTRVKEDDDGWTDDVLHLFRCVRLVGYGGYATLVHCLRSSDR
uniref:Uncharacterized protein n=1 Tax=Helianthus annuus TaxID=4232 RepID=A0A251U1X5_HELAN